MIADLNEAGGRTVADAIGGSFVALDVGELPAKKQALVRSVVQRIWGGGEDWKATVREQLHLEPSLDESLRGMWSRNQELAKQHKQELHGIQFAKTVVDQNFAHLVG